MKKRNLDVFTFLIKCSKEDENEVKWWLRGCKKSVRTAIKFLKLSSSMYADLNTEDIADSLDKT
jgi:hypothetical protein